MVIYVAWFLQAANEISSFVFNPRLEDFAGWLLPAVSLGVPLKKWCNFNICFITYAICKT